MINRNRWGNIDNPYQGSAKKVLCVCSAGMLRSPTAANVLYKEYGYNTRSAGCVSEFALIPLDEVLIAWADEIVCMEDSHAHAVQAMAQEVIGVDPAKLKIINLGIPDIYSWGDPELQKLILKNYRSSNPKEG